MIKKCIFLLVILTSIVLPAFGMLKRRLLFLGSAIGGSVGIKTGYDVVKGIHNNYKYNNNFSSALDQYAGSWRLRDKISTYRLSYDVKGSKPDYQTFILWKPEEFGKPTLGHRLATILIHAKKKILG